MGRQEGEIIGRGGEGYNLEKIAVLRPDLIIGMYAGADDISKDVYAKLSKIAPTVGYLAKYVSADRSRRGRSPRRCP